MKKFYLLCLLTLAPQAYAQSTNSNGFKLKAIGNIQRLAFASCNKHDKKQPLWQDLSRQSPDLFIWGGDNVYADGKGIAEILAAYKQQNAVEGYASFKAVTPIIGTWDDHDYGKNNGGNDYADKKLSQQYALDFLQEPLKSLRRKQEGIYTSYDFGEAGKKIKIILLDNRYFMNPKAGSILGEAQWKWLEQEINNSKASLHLVVSSISVLTPATIHTEEWAEYPAEKARLKRILKSGKKPYLYLTGDRHFSSIFTKEDELEFMSSGMTHNAPVAIRPYLRAIYPNTVFKHNYGLIDFEWEGSNPLLTLSVRTEQGQSLNQKRIKWISSRWTEI